MKLRRAGTITKILVFAILIYLTINLITVWHRTDAARHAQDDVRERIAEIEQQNIEREFNLQHYRDPRVIEMIARQSLGLIVQGEIVFYDGIAP